VADLVKTHKNMSLPIFVSFCYCTEFGCSALKGVGLNTGERQKLESAGTLLFWDGRCGWHQDTRPSSTCVTLWNVGVLCWV